MRNYPTADYGSKELHRLNAAEWMIEMLRLNPSYCSWGPDEDAMMDGGSWSAPVRFDDWQAFDWSLDDLNECVNFYFEINRDSISCETCGGSGYHPDAQWVSESFYRHSSPFTMPDDRERAAKAVMAQFGTNWNQSTVGRGNMPPQELLEKYGQPFRDFCNQMADSEGYWSNRITQDEVDVLVEHNRLFDFKRKGVLNPTADEVNQWNKSKGIGHDAINRAILIERRLERFGIPKTCETCEGNGDTFTEPAAHLSLILWMLVPRKGCSRGVEIKRVTQNDLGSIREWLLKAAQRNADRFKGVENISILAAV